MIQFPYEDAADVFRQWSCIKLFCHNPAPQISVLFPKIDPKIESALGFFFMWQNVTVNTLDTKHF